MEAKIKQSYNCHAITHPMRKNIPVPSGPFAPLYKPASSTFLFFSSYWSKHFQKRELDDNFSMHTPQNKQDHHLICRTDAAIQPGIGPNAVTTTGPAQDPKRLHTGLFPAARKPSWCDISTVPQISGLVAGQRRLAGLGGPNPPPLPAQHNRSLDCSAPS